MKKALSVIMVAAMLALSGCGNLSPRFKQPINNDHGKIGEIDSNQNGVKLELAKLTSELELQNSKLDHIQAGLANMQTQYTNTGVEVLSGPGGIIVAIIGVIGFTIAGIMVLHYRAEAHKNDKAASLLAAHIVEVGNEEHVFQSAVNTDIEDKILDLITRGQARLHKLVMREST